MSPFTRHISTIAVAALLLASAGPLLAQEAPAAAPSMVLSAPGNVTFGPIPGFPKGVDLGVVRGDPAKGGFDAYIRIQPGVRIPLHFHSSAESAVGVQGSFVLEMHDGTKKTLAPGVYTFIPWKMHHAASCPAGRTPCIGLFVFDQTFDVTWVEAPPANPNPAPSQRN